jgi:tRNA(Ile)-lysidine synthase
MIRIATTAKQDHDSLMILAGNSPWFAGVNRRKRWLVGVSGGADSVALLHGLVAAGFHNLVVCHLDHGLRGRDSTEDANFVKRLADSLGFPCEAERADVAGLMKTSNASMETAARHARHEFFARCSVKHRCVRVILAHHADDQAETVLWNLLRGSKGLKGMRSRQELVTESGVKLELHRPLLEFRHTELIEWLEGQGYHWREDASNAEPVAVRNRLRNEALPLLAEISKRDVTLAFARGAANTEELQALEAWALEKADVLDPQGRLHLPVLRKLPVALQRVALKQFLKDHEVESIDRELLERCLSLLEVTNSSVVNLPGGGKLKRREGRLEIER